MQRRFLSLMNLQMKLTFLDKRLLNKLFDYAAVDEPQKVITEYQDDKGVVLMIISYEDYIGVGHAFCAAEDMEFYSRKVGRNIAKYRAIENILRLMKKTKEQERVKKSKEQYIKDTNNFIKKVKLQRKRLAMGLDPINAPKFENLGEIK